MDSQEYAEYEAAVADFMHREGIARLTTGEPWCTTCNRRLEWHEGECPWCGTEVSYNSETYVSSDGCDCCGSTCQQNLMFASACNEDTGEIQEYQICESCEYYAEYGRLDDMTMEGIECP